MKAAHITGRSSHTEKVLWDQIWNIKKVQVLNFSCSLVTWRRRGIDGWHKIEQVSGEMKNVRPTQWPEWGWHFQTHGSVNVYTVWKKLIVGPRFRKRDRNQNSATKMLFRKAGGESESRLETLGGKCEGLRCNNYDVGMLLIRGVRDTLLLFPHFWKHHIKVLRFFLSWCDSWY